MTAPSSSATVIDVPKELECPVCLEPFSSPVSLVPCQHILCSHCATRLDRCPKCRSKIVERNPPDNAERLQAMINKLPARCIYCDWAGTKGDNHECRQPSAVVAEEKDLFPNHAQAFAPIPAVGSRRNADESGSEYRSVTSYGYMYPGWENYDRTRYWDDPYYYARCGV